MKDILDEELSKKPAEKPITLWYLHILEILLIPVILLGALEKIEHTQFFPGVSLLFWGLLLWAALSFFIPIKYEIIYQSKPINYFFSVIFGFALFTNLLGKLEKVEHTQFIPGVSLIYWASLSIIILAFVSPIIHEIRRNASSGFIIIAIIFSTIASFKFISILGLIEYGQTLLDINMNYITIIQLTSTIILLPSAITNKVFYRKYRYHYIRFFLLILLGI